MRALAVNPGGGEGVRMLTLPRPEPGPDEVLVEVLEVSLDGTDGALRTGRHGRPPAGEEWLIIGHESLGRVASVGGDVGALREGDLLTATVRRPCPERCPPCISGQLDLCSTGHYTERGIVGAHGYASDVYVEQPEWLIRVPASLREVGVLVEPLSIALKGLERAYAFQAGFEWQPRNALVIGAGSLGLLAAVLLRDRGLNLTSIDREDADSPKAARASNGRRVCQGGRCRLDVVLEGTRFDLVFEATGVSSLVFQAMCLLNFNGVLCVAGLPEGNQVLSVPANCIDLEMVLENRIVFGTVSSNVAHFRRTVELMTRMTQPYRNVLTEILTGRYPLQRYDEAFQAAMVKNVITF